MKRAGFTMIELIFVIVILGILAAVAIPKLAATRNDAKIAAEATADAQVLQNLGAEYTSQGAFTNYNLTEANAAVKCVSFSDSAAATTDTALTDGNITVTMLPNTTVGCKDPINAAVKTRLTDNGILGAAGAAKTYSFGGTGVKY